MSDKEILNSVIFARQSANFASVFDFVINNISISTEQLNNALGERHYKIVLYPIETSHWNLFIRVFEDNPLKQVFQNAIGMFLLCLLKFKGHTIWKTLVCFLVKQMRIGYEKACKAALPSWAQKKISVGEAFLSATQNRAPSSTSSKNTTPPSSPYHRSLSAHSAHPPISPNLIRQQAKKSVVELSKSAAKRFRNSKRGFTLDN